MKIQISNGQESSHDCLIGSVLCSSRRRRRRCSRRRDRHRRQEFAVTLAEAFHRAKASREV